MLARSVIVIGSGSSAVRLLMEIEKFRPVDSTELLVGGDEESKTACGVVDFLFLDTNGASEAERLVKVRSE